MSDHSPIDGVMPPPPSSERDQGYVTRDLEFALHRAVDELLDRVSAANGIGRRQAVPIVLRILSGLGHKEQP